MSPPVVIKALAARLCRGRNTEVHAPCTARWNQPRLTASCQPQLQRPALHTAHGTHDRTRQAPAVEDTHRTFCSTTACLRKPGSLLKQRHVVHRQRGALWRRRLVRVDRAVVYAVCRAGACLDGAGSGAPRCCVVIVSDVERLPLQPVGLQIDFSTRVSAVAHSQHMCVHDSWSHSAEACALHAGRGVPARFQRL